MMQGKPARTAVRACVLVLMLAVLPAAASPWEGEWKPWPTDYPRFDYSREELLAKWLDLHRRDSVPLPTADYVRKMLPESPDNPEPIAEQLLDGWRHFHAGDFQQAYRIGEQTGRPGYFLAAAAWLYYAKHLLDRDDDRVAMLREGVRRIAGKFDALEPPAAYWEMSGLALLYGQYSKLISTPRATNENIPGIVRGLLDQSLQIKDEQPAAHGVYGGFHTEIVDRVGGFLARVTYGARRDSAPEHFERSLELDPALLEARVEYGEALLRLWGAERGADARKQLIQAIEAEPQNAVDYLEQLRAKRVLKTYAAELGGS